MDFEALIIYIEQGVHNNGNEPTSPHINILHKYINSLNRFFESFNGIFIFRLEFIASRATAPFSADTGTFDETSVSTRIRWL